MDEISENFNFIKISFNRYKSNETSFKRYEIQFVDFSLTKWLIIRYIFLVTLFLLLIYINLIELAFLSGLICCVIILFQLNSLVKKEELLFIPTIGVQYSVTYGNGRTDLKFYHRRQIKDIIINEHVSLFRVTYYLCLILNEEHEKENNLASLLVNTRPKLNVLQIIYSEIKSVLK